MGACFGTAAAGTVPMDDIAISIFGLDNAGKTCFLRSLAGDFNFDSVPTVGLGQEQFMYDDTKLRVYDLGGGANFRRVWQRFFAEIWGFIYVVDASDPSRFEESVNTLKEMTHHKMMKGKPFIVVGNKQDIEGAVKADELRKKMKLNRKVNVYDAVVTQIDGDKCHPGVATAVSMLIFKILQNYSKLASKRAVDMEIQREIEARELAEKRARVERRRQEQMNAPPAR
jgi:ADP-ribosylation factor-like protein 13B